MSFCPRLGSSRSRKSEVSAPAGRGSGGHDTAQPIPNRWVSDTTEQKNDGNREPERWWSDSGPHGSFPKSEEHARSHIEWIRREKRVDQPDANARALNAVLKETAGKLYADRMHFLLELLQNADDCQYAPGVTPTVSLTYKEHGNGRATTLRVDCNEIGFHSENVRAICGFCESSKPAAKDHNRTTGEKGMGFKSVFEVADVVWISSGYYSFKFVNNDSGMLSMIAPHWAKLPDYERRLRGHTSMLLELSAKCDKTILLEKLKSMSPDTVLFLRNLKKIKISTIEAGKGRWETTLKRLDDGPAKDGMFSRTIQMGDTLASYHVFRHTINERDLRHDDRRRDAKDSQILLAFPKADDLKAQKVHAFLPIDHYGFKFAIQADFILVSSREDVEDCPWNKALVSQVPTAFLGAVKAFQAQDITSWISYISLDHYQNTLFQDIPARIVNVLSENSILQSDQGEWLVPSRLAIVPKRFRNTDGPLIPPGARITKYLSDGYDTAGNETRLEKLGVRTLSGKEFLSDLEAFLSDDQAKFQEMEAAWHASVASVLISLITESDAITAMVSRRRISNWNLIPVLKRGTEAGSLWDCSWISASQGTIFLPPDPRISIGLPGGLDLFEVHESVGEYPTWLDLLRLLKAEQYRVKRICDIIVSRHKSPGFSPANQSLDDLVSHAVFLKRARWSPPEGTKGDLWFAANRNSCHRGSSMYMKGNSVTQAGVPFTADVVFQNHLAQCPIHFTHESYESELAPYDKGAESWVVWLARCFDLTIIPRMALKGSSGAGQFTISPEFQFLVQNDPEAVLQLLREFWHLYSEWLVDKPGDNPKSSRQDQASRSRMRASLSSMEVPCVGGTRGALRNTVLPRMNVTRGIKLLTSTPQEAPKAATTQGMRVPTTVAAEQTRAINNQSQRSVPTPPEPLVEATDSSEPQKKSARHFLRFLRRLVPHSARKRTSLPEVIDGNPALVPNPPPPNIRTQVEWPTSRPGVVHVSEGEAKSPEDQTAAFTASLESRPFLQVADPDDKNWDFLEHFGVVTKIGMNHFLVQLRQLKGSTSTTLEAAALLYEHIEHFIGSNDIKTARQAFMTEELTLVPDPETTGYHWLTLEECVWDGPDCLKRTPRLKYIYPSRIQLFLYLLKCQTSDLVMLIQEAQSIRETDDLQHIAQVFEALSKHPDLSENSVHPLRELPIFPVTPADAPTGPYRLRTALDSDEWYIPDDPKLTRVFTDLDILSFPPSSLGSYRPLFDRLDLRHRLLSVAGEIALVPQGDVQPVPSYEIWLNKRMRFVIALVPTLEANKEEILLRLRHIHVFKAGRATMSWKIRRKDLSIALEQSSAVKCVGLLPTDEQDLNIWLTTQDTTTETDRLREIAFELAGFCGITNAKHTDMLVKVLTKQNRKHVEDEFRALGIPVEPTDSADNSEMSEYSVDQLPATTDLGPSIKESLGDGKETQVVKTLSVDRLKETDQTQAADEAPTIVKDQSEHEAPVDNPSQGADTLQDEAIKGRGAAHVEKPAGVPDIVVSQAPATTSSESMSPAEQSESEDTEQVTAKSNPPSQGVTEKQGGLESVTNNGASKTVQKPRHTKEVEPSKTRKGSRTTRTIPVDSHDLIENFDQATTEEDYSGETEYDKKRRGRRLGRRPGLSQTPSTHVLPSRDHSADRPEPRPRTPKSRGRDESSFVNMNQGWITVPRPMTIFSGEDTKETKYFGELYVSRFLQIFLGNDYRPNEHWTSPLRVRNGHMEYKTRVSDASTFTIVETGGKLSKALVDGHHATAECLANTITFHLEVWATNDALSTRFVVPNSQYKKLKRMSLVNQKHKVTDVYMLVRVYQIQKEPGIYIYVDPWGLQLKGDILLETEASYSARLPYSTEPFLKFSAAGFTKDTHEIYNGLDVGSREIRLLRLQLLDNGDEDDKPICGSLEVFDLGDLDEPFWAISYFWGPDPDGPAPSTFTSDRGKMPITESLASCLKCLRRKRVSTPLWADALCINQNNPMEKALQVRRMGSLYHQAEKVLVWLGTSGHKSESSPAMELMADLHRPFCHARGRCRTRKGLSERNTNATKVPDLSWKELDGFLGHSWFTRSWIVQEAAVCPKMTMVCGQSEMEWDCFMESLMECSNGLNRHGGLDDNGAFLANSRPALALHSLRERYQGGAKFDFLRLLDMFSYTQASRARDKLFALQNLARDVATEDPLFAPDYDSPEQEVLAKYAKGLVHRGRGLDLLYRAGGDKSSSICSWIPDLLNSQRRETTISTWDAAGREDGFCAGRPVPPRIHLQDMGSQNVPILAVRGSIIDEVEDCFELHLSAGMRVAFADVLERMRGYTSHLVDYPGFEQAPEATARKWTDKLMIKCLVGDARGPRAVSKQSTTYSTEASRRAPITTATWKDSDWEQILDLDLGQNAWKYKEETSPESQRRLMQFWETAVAFADNIPRAVFATTKKRYAGIIPGAAQPGDKIFIADGAKVPFIISRSARVTTCYRLVGECYIHGIMYSPPSTAPDKGADIFLV